MSGKIENFISTEVENVYLIQVNFLEQDYFKDDLVPGNVFTINEVSKILGSGQVIYSTKE